MICLLTDKVGERIFLMAISKTVVGEDYSIFYDMPWGGNSSFCGPDLGKKRSRNVPVTIMIGSGNTH